MTNNERDVAEMLKEALEQWQHCLKLAYRAPENLKPQQDRIDQIREHASKLGLWATTV